MKKVIVLFAVLLTATLSAQEVKNKVVEASCGQCNFGMKGAGCALAVKIDGKPYFVDGAAIDKFGDAHAADGFCEAIRQAEVTGEIKDGRFKAESFKLLPSKTK